MIVTIQKRMDDNKISSLEYGEKKRIEFPSSGELGISAHDVRISGKIYLFDEVLFWDGGGGNFFIVYGYKAQAFSLRYSSMLYFDC